jgi:hypothetical protein
VSETPAIDNSEVHPNYDTDFYAWTQHQVELLRAKRFGDLDLANLIEEIESLGKSEKRSLTSHLGVLIGHLIKWQYQPDYPYKKSWRATIRERRRQIHKLLTENPSLKAQLAEFIADAYESGLNLAVSETPLDYDSFPETCPWTNEQILGNYWPE